MPVREARRLGIPVAAVVDTNSNPDGINFPVPGNDDAARAAGPGPRKTLYREDS